MSGEAEEIFGACTCHEAYKSRNLVDHDCDLCNFAEEVRIAIREAELRGRREGFDASREGTIRSDRFGLVSAYRYKTFEDFERARKEK